MRCQRADKTCFACMPEGECNALEETYWNGRKCPFYKPADSDYDNEVYIEGFDLPFKRVRGFGEKYFVDESGKVINNIRQELHIYMTERNFPYVRLYLWGGQIRTYLAAIVADSWVPGKGRIDFRDGDPTNCTAQNIFRR